MAAKERGLRLRPLAEGDLEKIWLYSFKHWSARQADSYVRDLLSTMDELALGSKTGWKCSARDGYFQYAVGSHLIFYRVTTTTLEVSRILYQRMDTMQHL